MFWEARHFEIIKQRGGKLNTETEPGFKQNISLLLDSLCKQQTLKGVEKASPCWCRKVSLDHSNSLEVVGKRWKAFWKLPCSLILNAELFFLVRWFRGRLSLFYCHHVIRKADEEIKLSFLNEVAFESIHLKFPASGIWQLIMEPIDDTKLRISQNVVVMPEQENWLHSLQEIQFPQEKWFHGSESGLMLGIRLQVCLKPSSSCLAFTDREKHEVLKGELPTVRKKLA